MTIEIKEGNALEQTKGLIIHQTNTIGAMGAGIALQIARKWPDAEQEYIAYCKKYGADALGTVQFTQLTDDLWLANLFGQVAPGPRATVYEAYPKALRVIVDEFGDTDLHLPYLIGCGLAGGDWDVVFPLLQVYLEPVSDVKLWKLV